MQNSSVLIKHSSILLNNPRFSAGAGRRFARRGGDEPLHGEQNMRNCALKMVDFVLKVVSFVLKMMDFALKMVIFAAPPGVQREELHARGWVYCAFRLI